MDFFFFSTGIFKIFNKDKIIISTDPEASYNLKKNNYKYFEIHNICDHKKLWDEYKIITDKIAVATNPL